MKNSNLIKNIKKSQEGEGFVEILRSPPLITFSAHHHFGHKIAFHNVCARNSHKTHTSGCSERQKAEKTPKKGKRERKREKKGQVNGPRKEGNFFLFRFWGAGRGERQSSC